MQLNGAATTASSPACEILASKKHAFKEDCGLDLQLGKCKMYLKGMPIEEARSFGIQLMPIRHAAAAR